MPNHPTTDVRIMLEALAFGLDYEAGDSEGDEDERERHAQHEKWQAAVYAAGLTQKVTKDVLDALEDCFQYSPDWLMRDPVYRASAAVLARNGRLEAVSTGEDVRRYHKIGGGTVYLIVDKIKYWAP